MTMTEQLQQPTRQRFAISPRRLITLGGLTLAWCGLWQQVSAANLISGFVLSVVVLSAGVGTSTKGPIRLVPLARLFWTVLVDLVQSTIDVAKEILTPTDNISEAIIAVELPDHGKHHFLLLIVGITLTPGTAVVDADPDNGTLYLHLLRHDRADEVRAHVAVLADLADQALPPSTDSSPRSQP